jgi:hypothetical protein
MKELFSKGGAGHPGPESCVASREAGRATLTRAHAHRESSCETIATKVPTRFNRVEGNAGGCMSKKSDFPELRPLTDGFDIFQHVFNSRGGKICSVRGLQTTPTV